MHSRQAAVGALAVVLVLAAVATPAVGASVTTIDADHPLASDTATTAYHEDGVVTGHMPGVALQLTVADDADDVGLNDWTTRSSGRAFLKVDYNEEIDREVRIYLPASYFNPRLRESLAPMDGGGQPIAIEPVHDREYSAVTLHLRENTTAVYAIPATRGLYSSARDDVKKIVNETTGVELPSLDSGGQQWEYIQPSEFAGDRATVAIETNSTDHAIQYDAAGPGEERWVPVRDCESSSDQPVCTFTQGEQANTTYVLATAETPPPIRYKSEASGFSDIDGAINDNVNAVKRLVDQLTGALGGD